MITEEAAELVFRASIATVEALGPMPNNIEDMPAHMAKWANLMRQHEPRLLEVSDRDIKLVLSANDGDY